MNFSVMILVSIFMMMHWYWLFSKKCKIYRFLCLKAMVRLAGLPGSGWGTQLYNERELSIGSFNMSK